MREDMEKANEHDDDDTQIPSESRISKQLSEEITKVVVSLVLIMLFVAPIFQMETWVDVQIYHKAALDMAIKTYNRGLQEFEGLNEQSWPAYQESVITLEKDTDEGSFYPILWYSLPDPDGSPFNTEIIEEQPNKDAIETDPTQLRITDFDALFKKADNGIEFVIAYSIRSMARTEAIINIARTFFVTCVFAIAAVFFNSITNKWVMLPIERMLEKVRLIAKNPLAVAQDDADLAGIYTMMHKT